jgi:chromosome segregation ATPase
MDTLSQKLESTSQQLSKTLNEAETLRNAHTVNMSTIASMQQRLEASDKLLEKTRNECSNLKEDSKNLIVLRKEIETLNQEVIRWKEASEENAQQLKQEVKLRKNIERDIQKIVGRFDSGQQ